jgi:hypothetical protein
VAVGETAQEVVQLADCVRHRVRKVHFVVRTLECVLKRQLEKPFASVAQLVELRDGQLRQPVTYVVARFAPALVSYFFRFEVWLGTRVSQVKFGFNVDPHAVHVQTLVLSEVDHVELDRAYALLVAQTKEEPLVMATSV